MSNFWAAEDTTLGCEAQAIDHQQVADFLGFEKAAWSGSHFCNKGLSKRIPCQ